MGNSLLIILKTIYETRYKTLAIATIATLVSAIPGILAPESYTATAIIETDPSISNEMDSYRSESRPRDSNRAPTILDTNSRLYILGKHPTTAARTLSKASVRAKLSKYFDVREEALIDLTLPHMSSNQSESYEYTRSEVQLLSKFKELFSVKQSASQNRILLLTTTADPQLSASLANQHAQSMIDMAQTQWKTQQDAYIEFLEHKIAQTNTSLSDAGEKLVSEVDHKGGGKARERAEQRINYLNDRLAKVLGIRVELEAMYAEADGLAALSMQDETLQKLLERQTEITQEYSGMRSALGSKHPRLLQKVAELRSIEKAITGRKETLKNAIPMKLNALRKEEKNLRKQIGQERENLKALNEPSFVYKVHGNEFETLKSTGEFWRTKHAQALIAVKQRKPLASLSHPALVPHTSNPRVTYEKCAKVFVSFAFFSIIIFGILGTKRKRFENKEQADLYLQVPTLGVIPEILTTTEEVSLLALPERTDGIGTITREKVQSLDQDRSSSENLPQVAKTRLLSRRVHLPSQNNLPPPSTISPKEAFRALRTELMLSQPTDSRVLMVTSPTTGEGKTTICSNLAVTLSRAGYNTLLIHANLRKTGIGESILAQCPQAGLAEHLLGQAKARDIISQTVLDNLYVVSTGTALLDSVDLLFSRKMQAFVTQMRSLFDYVIIDAPSVLPWSDAKILARLSDVVSMVIDCHTTDKRLAREALKQLHDSHTAVSGLILNRYRAETDFERYYGT